MLVCPECGNGSFEATLTTRTEYTYQVLEGGSLCETASTVVDGGDEGDIEALTCTDCGVNFEHDELVAEEAYDFDSCGGLHDFNDCG